MEYVYKYLNNRGDTVYVGITNDMPRRVREHKSDKLKEIKNPLIFYFPVQYRADAEMLETYLIGWYGTKRHYNVSKTRKGDFSFLDVCEDFPWKRYVEGEPIEGEPFVISDVIATRKVIVEKEKIVEKKVYVKDERNEIILAGYRMRDTGKALDDFIKETEDYISFLNGLKLSNDPDVDYTKVDKALFLYKKRLKILGLQKKLYKYDFIKEGYADVSTDIHKTKKRKYKRLVKIAVNLSNDIDEFFRAG